MENSKFNGFKHCCVTVNLAKPEEATWFLKEPEGISNIFASSILALKGKK